MPLWQSQSLPRLEREFGTISRWIRISYILYIEGLDFSQLQENFIEAVNEKKQRKKNPTCVPVLLSEKNPRAS